MNITGRMTSYRIAGKVLIDVGQTVLVYTVCSSTANNRFGHRSKAPFHDSVTHSKQRLSVGVHATDLLSTEGCANRQYMLLFSKQAIQARQVR